MYSARVSAPILTPPLKVASPVTVNVLLADKVVKAPVLAVVLPIGVLLIEVKLPEPAATAPAI